MKKLLTFGLALLALAGCGGGGGGTGSVPGGAHVTAYATDSINDDYDHVWVKLHKVELVGDSGRAIVFEDATGRDVDLKSLRDGTGPKFSVLDSASVAAGTYKQIDVTLANSATLFARGSTSGVAREFDDRYDHPVEGTKSLLTMNAPGLVVAGKTNVVVDFDLAQWLVQANGRISALLVRSSGNGLNDDNRHVDDDFGGQISALSGTAPNFSFTLLRGNGRHFSVKTSASTRIFNENGAANPQLAAGQKVEVTGSMVAGIFLAAAIKIESGSGGGGGGAGEDPHKIKGATSALSAATGEFTIAVELARGFTPTSTSYRVKTTASTRFLSDTGATISQAQFFTDLAAAGKAEVEGIASSDGTFRPVKVKIENENDASEAELKGPITSISASGFVMTVQSWENVSLSGGESITVSFRNGTQFRLGNNFVSQATFMNAMSTGSLVEVKGALSGSSLTAIRVKDED